MIKFRRILLSVASAFVIAMSSVVYTFAESTSQGSGSIVIRGVVIGSSGGGSETTTPGGSETTTPSTTTGGSETTTTGGGDSGGGNTVSVTVPVTENILVGTYIDSATNKRVVGSPSNGEVIAVFSNQNSVGSSVSVAISGYKMAKTSGSGVILSTRTSFTSSMTLKYLTLKLLTSNASQTSGSINSSFFDTATNYTSTIMSATGTVMWATPKQLGTMQPSGGTKTEVGFSFGGIVNTYCTTWTAGDTLTINIIYNIVPLA